MRRDFLDAGRAFAELEPWALEWKEQIGTLYHLNRLRLEQWDRERPLAQQSAAFQRYHEALQAPLQRMHEEATRSVAPQRVVVQNDEGAHREGAALSKSAHTRQKKVLASLLEHWPGLTVFVEHPQAPMDNNLAENTIRTPVNGHTITHNSPQCHAEPPARARNRGYVVDRSRAFSGLGSHRLCG